MKQYNVYVDYSEIINVEANSEEEAVQKAIDVCEQNDTTIRLSKEAEFKAEEVE